MIWFLTVGLCVVVFAYIATPLFFKNLATQNIETPAQAEVLAYRRELQHIEKTLESGECDVEALTAEKTLLEKRLVKAATQGSDVSSYRKTAWMTGIFAVLIASTLGIYGAIGSPELTVENVVKPAVLSSEQALSQNAPKLQHENDSSMEDLIAGLERKLQADGQNPQQWGLYARSLMTVNRFDEAFAAYEKTLSLTDNNPEILAELESARAFAAQQNTSAQGQGVSSPQSPGPSREDVEAAAQMTTDDRNAMIQGMVEGLSQKLAENPDDPTGWVRLLRARQVLGQSDAAEKEIAVLRVHFQNDPQTVTEILMQSGWSN